MSKSRQRKTVKNSQFLTNAHTLAYSIVALQEANLAYKYPIIYWNCANLISDSGGIDGTVNYGKNATAITRMRKEGIDVVPPYINEAEFDFSPDVKNNQIIFGLKSVKGVGAAEAQTIEKNRPYTSAEDFYNKMMEYKKTDPDAKFGDTTMIQLIKAGSFDKIEEKDRVEIMKDFISRACGHVTKLTTAHIPELTELGLIPAEYNKALNLLKFKKCLYNRKHLIEKKGKSPATEFYRIPFEVEDYFLRNIYDLSSDSGELKRGKDYNEDNGYVIKRGALDKLIDDKEIVKKFKEEVLESEEVLNTINKKRFNNMWNDKASGSISKWEMDSLCYYYHTHELNDVNFKKYMISDFFKINPEPEIEDTYDFGGKKVHKYKLKCICGTVIDKDASHNTISLLTIGGVVTVKLYKGEFTYYAKTITQKNPDGTKTIIEPSWFTRGTKLLVVGIKAGDIFIPKKYKESDFDYPLTIQKIEGVKDGNLILKNNREEGDEE